MAETWLQAALDCPQTGVVAVEETFERLGALVTWTQAADDQEILEPEPGAMPLWCAVRLTALVEREGVRAARKRATRPGSSMAVTSMRTSR